MSELSYNLLKTQIAILSSQIGTLEKLVPVPNTLELSNNFSKNIYLGLSQKTQENVGNICPTNLIEVENCEDIYFSNGGEEICKNHYMQWNHTGKYCNQYVKCIAKNYPNKTHYSNCGVDLDASCNKQSYNGEWRKFI